MWTRWTCCQVFPPWMRATFDAVKLVPDIAVDAVDEVIEESAAVEWAEPRPLMPFALQIPGSLHILDNLQKDLLGCLTHYSAHLQKLKIFQTLLHEPDYRERLQWTCLKGLPLTAKTHTHKIPLAWSESSQK